MDYNYLSRYFIGLHDRENVKFYGFTVLTNSMPSGIPKAIRTCRHYYLYRMKTLSETKIPSKETEKKLERNISTYLFVPYSKLVIFI
jgi:hypothetical protein